MLNMLKPKWNRSQGRNRNRRLPALAASFALVWGMGLADAPAALAQEELTAPAEDEANDKTPVYAYVITSLLGGLCMFAICKSARR